MQQLAEQQSRHERLEASMAIVVEMLCVEAVNEEGGYLSMKERSAIPLSERASRLEKLEDRMEAWDEELQAKLAAKADR